MLKPTLFHLIIVSESSTYGGLLTGVGVALVVVAVVAGVIIQRRIRMR